MEHRLNDYLARTAWVHASLPQDALCTAASLPDKVGPEGTLLPFYGNTVIFDLDPADKAWLADLQSGLHRAFGDLLAEPIAPDTFHITLHDLVSGSDPAALAGPMASAASHARGILQDIGRFLPPAMAVRPLAMCSMANTSIVLTFAPADDEVCRHLADSYAALHDVVPLSWGLTLHVTLAYYRPGVIPGERLAALQAHFDAAHFPDEMPLRRDALYLSDFLSMNDYRFHPKE